MPDIIPDELVKLAGQAIQDAKKAETVALQAVQSAAKLKDTAKWPKWNKGEWIVNKAKAEEAYETLKKALNDIRGARWDLVDFLGR